MLYDNCTLPAYSWLPRLVALFPLCLVFTFCQVLVITKSFLYHLDAFLFQAKDS